MEWIGQAPAFVAENKYGLVGCIISSIENSNVSWLRAAAVSEGIPAGIIMKRLLLACFKALVDLNIPAFCAMPVEPWLYSILQDTDFSVVEYVESWGKTGLKTSKIGNQAVHIRPVLRQDLDILEQIEEKAHHPRWQYSVPMLELAMKEADMFTIAQLDQEIIGFQISLVMEKRGHLARLTVHPEKQGQGIGTRLLADVFAQLAKTGLTEITLNTQTDNIPSHQLYTSFGFQRISPPLRIWEYNINPQTSIR